MTARIELTAVEMEMGVVVAKARQIESVMAGRKNSHGYDGRNAWSDNIHGALAELAYCKYRGVYWGGTVGSFKNADVGEKIQIRYSNNQKHPYLIVRPGDPPDHYYFLVTGGKSGGNVYFIIGYILGADAMNDEFLRAPDPKRPPAYCIEPHMMTLVK